MKAYWDSSALVEVILNRPRDVAAFEAEHERVTRAHALVEVFATLTGGKLRDDQGNSFRLDPADAAVAVAQQASHVKVVVLSGQQTLEALSKAKKNGVRGAHVHDWMHIAAAETEVVERIYTHNISHFGPFTNLEVTKP